MIRQSKISGHRSFILFVVSLLFCTSAFALSESDSLLVTENLSQKLRTDLADNQVTVELNSFAEQKKSGGEIEFKGDATATLSDKNERLPVQFAVKINSVNRRVTDVQYNFVEDSSAYEPTASEEVLMKELMAKIRQDYKTENIVIAIDAVEKVGGANNENKFLGVGEVRIGDFVWNRIKFDVSLDAQTQKANKVVYRVEK